MEVTTEQQARYEQALNQLLPPGMAWQLEDTSVLTLIHSALAKTFGRVDARTQQLLAEMDPRTALEMLKEWEVWVGLPDTCTNYAGKTLSERRILLWQHLTRRRSLALTMYKELANALGYSIEIIPHGKPFVCGRSRCGHALGGGAIERLVWKVTIIGHRHRDFICGSSRCGQSLGSIIRATDLECLLHKLKPAHTELVVAYQ